MVTGRRVARVSAGRRRRLLIPFAVWILEIGMRSAAVAGLCRVSTNRVVLFVLCPYKVMPRDRRKVAVERASPTRGDGVGNHGRSVHGAARPPPIGAHRHRPREPAAVDSSSRMHTGPGRLGHFTKTTVTVVPPIREYIFTSSSTSPTVDFSQVNMIFALLLFVPIPSFTISRLILRRKFKFPGFASQTLPTPAFP